MDKMKTGEQIMRIILSTCLALAATTLAAAVTPAAKAATIINGGFEQASPRVSLPPSNTFTTLGIGSTAILGWTVVANTIDWIGTGYWQASQGTRSLDMTGTPGAGKIQQEVGGLLPGNSYRVDFDMAGNIAGLPTIKTLRMSIAGQSQDFVFDGAGKSYANMGWEQKSLVFTYDAGESNLLVFQSLDSGFTGPALDNVRISAVPLPAAFPLMLGGLGAMALAARRRKG